MVGRVVSRIGVRGGLGAGSVRAIASAAAALAMLTTIVGAGWNNGHPVDKVRLLSGAAWLPSRQVGQLTLLDGPSAEVAAQVEVATPGDQLDAVQSGTTAYAINRTAGSIRRVDGGTFELTPSVKPIPGAGEGLQAYASADALYALDTRGGVLTQTDPRTLAGRSGPLLLAAQVDAQAATVDDDGRLWVLDTTTGDLIWIKDGQRRTRREAIKPGPGMLVLADGSPVLIDIQSRTAATLNQDTGDAEKTTELDLRSNDTLQVGGSPHSPRLYVVTSRGVLQVYDLTGTSRGYPVSLGNASAQLGRPIETGNRVFIPDYTSGQVRIVDLQEKRVVAQRPVLSPAVRFQLLTRDGVVFYNDPDSERAGVISLDGGVVEVPKYDPQSPNKGLTMTPFTAGNPPPTPPFTTSTSAGLTSTNAPGSTATTAPKSDQSTSTQGSRPISPTTGQPSPTTPLDVPPAVQIVVSKSQPQIGENVNLKATAVSGPDPTSAQWTFGDGQGSNDVQTTHRWDNAQTYQVVVRATFSNDQTATASLPIQVIPTATPQQALAITMTGSGTGTVNSDPAGISCPPACTAQFAENRVVGLTATTSGGSVFAGWSGEGCSGTGTTCQLTMSTNAVNITATFNPSPPTPTPSPPTPTPSPPTPTSTPAPPAKKCSPGPSADRPANGLTIKSPGSGGKVGGWNEASGTANLTSNQRLWLLLCAPEVEPDVGGDVGGFYRESEEPVSVSGGTWKQGFRLDTRYPGAYKLYAVIVNADQVPYEFVVRDGNGVKFGRQLPQNAHYVHVDVTCCS